MSAGLPFPYPPGMYGSGFEGIMPSDVNMVEFLSIMSGMSDYSISNQQFMLPDNMFDYLYQQQQQRSDSSLDKNGQHSPADSVD